MSAHNRHVRGKTNDNLVEVRGNVVIESGDMMFIFGTDGDLGANWTADNRAYPFGWARAVTAGTNELEIVYTDFVGIAMKSSKSGVTEKIAIASSGVFRKPLANKSAVTVGALISAVSEARTRAAGVSQSVYTSTTAPGSTAYLGYCSKTESGATLVDFELRTIFNTLAT